MDRPAGFRQLPLDLGHSAGFSRDDLILSPANAEAVRHIERWPDWPSPVTILAGPPGSGKSHLAAIWRERSAALDIGRREVQLRVSSGISSASIMIDDIDSDKIDESGLFHLINDVRGQGSTLLLTARGFPAAWGISLPDLQSRLRAATLVEIHEPDDMLLQGVIAKLFADRQIEVEPHVVQFLTRRIERSLAAANAMVARLDKAALERKSRITRTLAAEVVDAFDAGQGEFAL